MTESVQNVSLKAGSLVTFSSGEYSDYGYRGTYVALQDVSFEEMMEVVEFVKSKAEKEDPDYPNAQPLFEPELIRRGWLLSVPMHEIHIGGYNSLELS